MLGASCVWVGDGRKTLISFVASVGACASLFKASEQAGSRGGVLGGAVPGPARELGTHCPDSTWSWGCPDQNPLLCPTLPLPPPRNNPSANSGGSASRVCPQAFV